ncbi:TetR/AcrR family transcriptional regulator [Desulfogranum japonicum]|uniref:TetR/AcrR family transcriptional regulator n=1 Tax=Desulfogranum japonicum TaxID=231447 RepID=UPI0004212F85|nr:TetR/AcrR family transcriptional regulator [Desulfogranum japonicum]
MKETKQPDIETGNKQDERSRRTSSRILTEARRLFAEYGFTGVSAEQIVATAGVTRGALYHHFDGKKGLFRAVLNQVQTEIEERVKNAVAQVQDPMEMLIAGNNEFLAACLDPGLQRILLTEGPAVLGWEEWRAVDEDHVQGKYRAFLAKLMDNGVLRPFPVDALAHIISGAANEAAFWAARAEDPETALAQAQSTMAEMIRALRSE